MENLIKYHPGFDELSGEERHLLPRTLKSIQKFIEVSAEISHTDYATRDAHSKAYAMLKGNFEKADALPDFVNEIFTEEHYSVVLRLSHANPVIMRSGKDSPAFGFAIKLENIQGKEANFPLVNFPIFPVKSGADFLRFFTTLNTFLYTKQDNFLVSAMDVPFLIKHFGKLLPGMFGWDMLKNTKKILAKKQDFIASFDFYSIGVYRAGNFMMKLKAEPEVFLPRYGHTLPQKERLENYLENHSISYILKAQFCADETLQPINNLAKEWKNAPFVSLGKLTFEKTGLINPESPENENMGFNPFDNPQELLPVGRIQQLRKEIYKTSIETRRKLNGFNK